MNSFLEQALSIFCSSHPLFGESTVYVRFDEEPADNEGNGFSSDIIFGHIVYRSPAGEELISPPLMLKTMPTICKFRPSLLVDFFNEVYFYTRAMPIFQELGDLQSLLAQFYDSHIQLRAGTTSFLLIFENLRPRGFRVHQRHSFLDVDHLSLMLRKLGHFHSFSYRAKVTDAQEFDNLGSWFRSHLEAVAQKNPKWLQKIGQRGLQPLQVDRRYSHRLAQLEEVVNHAEEFVERMNTREQCEPLSVLCHGDFLRGNVLFRYENGRPVDLKMIDMASCKIASPVVDLSTVLYLNADQKTRDEHWDRLIDSYCAGLWELFDGEGIPSRESIVEEFRGRALYGYFIASFFLGHVIALDRGMPTILELVPKEYASQTQEIPGHIRDSLCQIVGGEECTEALANILRDIIDRGFASI